MQNSAHRIPLEQQYFSLNFSTLLHRYYSKDEIELLAKSAFENRMSRMDEYDAYLQSFSSLQNSQRIAHHIPNSSEINKSPSIVALFHFGKHRNIISDLVLNGITVAAPIAGQSYHDFYKIKDKLSPEYGKNLTLLDVAKSDVGRELVRAARSSEVLAMYADGNMGPDGHHANEGASEVEFFGHSIRVKKGIARLAKLLKRPIIPLLSISHQGSYRLSIGAPIPHPSREDNDAEIMQNLYNQLASKVKASPQDWEYGLCFHRWLSAPHSTSFPNPNNSYDDSKLFNFNSNSYKSLHMGNEHYIVNLQTHRALKIPFNPEWLFAYPMNKDSILSRVSENAGWDDSKSQKLFSELVEKSILIQNTSGETK